MADKECNMEWPPGLAPYVILIDAFRSGRLSGVEFEKVFYALFSVDDRIQPGAVADVLDEFSAIIDSFTPEPTLRVKGEDIDEEALRVEAASTLEKLREARLRE